MLMENQKALSIVVTVLVLEIVCRSAKAQFEEVSLHKFDSLHLGNSLEGVSASTSGRGLGYVEIADLNRPDGSRVLLGFQPILVSSTFGTNASSFRPTLVPTHNFTEQQSDAPSGSSDGWKFVLAPYMWMAGINGDVRVRSIPASVKAGFSDVWDSLELGGMIHLEASKKNWTLLFDGAYLGLGDARGPLDADLDEVWAEISVQTKSSVRWTCTRRLRRSPGGGYRTIESWTVSI